MPKNNKVVTDWKSALERLKDGNNRFTSGLRSIETMTSVEKLPFLAENGQEPFAIVLTCSDSRVPAELIFDQGAGDLFMIRVAGNIIAPSLLASMEFAATNLKCPLILVMGHSGCGAISAAIKIVKEKVAIQTLGKNLSDLIARITPAIERVPSMQDHEKFNEYCTNENVKHSIEMILAESEIIAKLVQEDKLNIIGSIFDLKTGKVEFQKTF